MNGCPKANDKVEITYALNEYRFDLLSPLIHTLWKMVEIETYKYLSKLRFVNCYVFRNNELKGN